MAIKHLTVPSVEKQWVQGLIQKHGDTKHQETPQPVPDAQELRTNHDTTVSSNRDTMIPRYHDTEIPRHHETKVATTIPQHHATIPETTRRAVKQLGKEAATHRFTVAEKKALRAVEQAYLDQGIRTSENELTRIAINYLLEEYRVNGDKSILAQVLTLLHS